jgi:type II secretory ATPase GspE/PulE/Tfp pilus assembly ATPase PilB-like protein
MAKPMNPPELVNLDKLPPDQVMASLLDQASILPASDLFLHTQADHLAVTVRHFGIVRDLIHIPVELGRRCISYVKAMANMDLAERRRPIDGRWMYEPPNGSSTFDIRINTLPTLYGEDCAMRLLMHDRVLHKLEELGLIQAEFNELMGMLNSPSGLILVTGPTGSGKTTSLYASLNYLNNGRRKINTIEDPVEYGVEGIRQSQVNPKIDLNYPELLRSVLRQAPDVIMIGEIRDPITASTAVHAANSGHLVLATLHAPIASAAPQSMLAWGVNPSFLASSLLGVVAQRLVRTLCKDCRQAVPLAESPGTFDEVQRWMQPGMGNFLFSPRGCPKCHNSGYAGRSGVFEVMRISREVRPLIADSRPARDIHDVAVKHGFIELRHSALLKVAEGVTTAEEVIRNVPTEYLGIDY